MKKMEAVVFILLILVGCGIIIFKLLDTNSGDVYKPTTTTIKETKDGFELKQNEESFKEYFINKKDISNINISVSDLNIDFNNNILYINDKKIIENIEIFRNFYLYEDLYVFGFSYKNNLYDGLVLYDTIDNTFKILDKINGLHIDLENYSGNINGILLNTSMVFKDKIIISNKSFDICNYKEDTIEKVKISLVYLYDQNDNNFNEIEEVSSITLTGYINSNALCK